MSVTDKSPNKRTMDDTILLIHYITTWPRIQDNAPWACKPLRYIPGRPHSLASTWEPSSMYRNRGPCGSPSYVLSPSISTGSIRLRLRRQDSKAGNGKGFVNISATWSLEDMNLIWSCFWATLSLTKWKSTSICLVRAWKTGLADKYVAPILSHHSIGILVSENPNSLSNDCTQIISAVALATALYSDSVLER